MKWAAIFGLSLSFAGGYGSLAQVAPDHAKDWQNQVYPLRPEPTDERSRALLKERGDYFDQFAPKHPGDSMPYSSIGATPELPTVMSNTIVIAKFSEHTVHLTPSGRYVYTERVFTPSNVILGGPGNLRANVQISVLDNGGAVLKPTGEIVRIPSFPTEFGVIPGHTYLLFLGYLPSCEAYELFKSWDVTTGYAVPNAPEDIEAARRHKSKNAGVPVNTLIAHVKETLARQMQGHP